MAARTALANDPTLRRFREELAATGAVTSVVLYGPAAHGDDYDDASFHVLIILGELGLASLAAVAPAVARWRRKGRPTPRIFSAASLAGASDVFPIELLDLAAHRLVLLGEDPLVGLDVRPDHLRLQCERELREKLLRLEEGYLEAHDRPRLLGRLVKSSYLSFALIFRGCLRLLEAPVPRSDADVHRELCRRLDLDPGPFDEAERLGRGQPARDATALFTRYYELLRRLLERVDSLSFTRENPHG